jgi:GT2 family glycosyltransferase
VENCSSHFPGQHAVSSLEHYWRQDQFTNPILFERYFEVDAVMRGPLLMSSKAIKEIGLLDERYAPLYSDDMAWCAKARENGYRIMALTGEVYNNSQTMTTSSELQNKIYLDAYQQNTKLYYQEWPPSDVKNYQTWARTIWRVPKSRSYSFVSLMKNPYSLNRKILSTYVYVNYPIISKGIRVILQSTRKLAP